MLKIQNILILFNFFFFLSKSEIINNPVLITSNQNPIILQDANYFFIYTSGEIVIINKSNGQIYLTSPFGTYTKPYIWITDQSNNYYIFAQNAMYKVVIPNSYNEVSKPIIQYPTSSIYIGYMKETKYTSVSTLPGCLTSVLQDEIIIYGKSGTTQITFAFLKKSISYQMDLGSYFDELEDIMSCKVISNGQYICAIIGDNIVYIIIFAHIINNYSLNTNSLSLIKIIMFNGLLNTHTSVTLYDMSNNNYKLACAININTYYMECLYFMTEFKITYASNKCTNNVELARSDYVISYPVDPNTNGDCKLATFGSELIFCCPGPDKISCSRNKNDFTFINTFELDFPGENSKIDIFTDRSNYAAIFFMNNDDYEKILEYYIFLPTCDDLDFTIIVYHSINENKEESEFVDLKNMFTRKTNTKYYFEFETIPDEYGDLLINNETVIFGNNSKFLFEENASYILDFISTNDKVVDNFQIPFKIFIEESYSASCTMSLTILPCYDSCSRCSKDKSISTPDNHNCYENKCKPGYYPAPDVVTNCFTESEKQPNWYLDYSTMRFALCSEYCSKCYGPNSDNCLSCYSYETKPELAYFLDYKCFNECPEGTYPVMQSDGNYYKCKDCFPGCKTCHEYGNSFNMKCDSCNENNIIFNRNCYIEYDSNEKTFYKPESNTDITSCKEFLDLYIEENSYECVLNMPSEGYYMINSNTGLFGKCHLDCKTCRRKYTESSTNCDTCINSEYNLLEGNCLASCPDGYYSTVVGGIKVCRNCHSNCMTCNSGAVYNNVNKLTNMNCLTCKKIEDPNDSNNFIENKIQIESNCFPIITYNEEKITFDISVLGTGETEKSCLDYSLSIFHGQYKCIIKQNNYFYVLDNDENTGVVKQCDISCESCHGEKDETSQDTNCINCATGYYKTEESNTNCILESLIPENYFKNDLDNIYYKCFINCKKCNNFYNSATDNMNCVECIIDYYFVYGTNNCYDMSFIDENEYYFFSERDNKFHQCYFSCLRCSRLELDEFNHNCDECISGFYFEYNTNNCYDMSILERGYYFDDFTITDGEEPVFKKCYENCKTCSNTLIGNNMNCILCKDSLHKIKGTNNCYDDSLIDQGYYLKDDFFFPCEESCKTCSNSKTIENGVTSNNCLTCDYNTKGLYLVSDLNNCEPESYKEKGYYLKEDQNNPDILLFHKCYQSCSLCDKEKEFDSLTNQYDHNCLKCMNNYYPKMADENPKNCYNEEDMASTDYILVRNYWTICHENCESCSVKPLYDSKNKIISQNCLSCYSDLHFIYGTSDCYDSSILEEGYYLDDNDLMYHKCDIQCIKCEKYSTPDDPKCKKCNSDSGYYPAVNKPASRCYNQDTIDAGYILSDFEDSNTGEITRKWMICYETCKTCKDFGNELDNNCINCISGHYLIYGTSNCITDEYAKNNGYYFNNTYRQYVKCDKACINCNQGLEGDNTNCIKCNEQDGYYPIKGKNPSMCFSEETIEEGYFFNNFEEPYKWEECYEYCATCEYKGNPNRMACLSCKTNIMNKEYNKKIYLKFHNGNCKIGCPENLFLTKQLDCVVSCLNNTYEYIPNVTCVDTCPENYVINPERTRCVFSSFAGATSPTEFRDIIFTNITSFVNSSTVINGTTFKAQITSSSEIDPIEQIKNGISGLDFGDCFDTLKAEYNIPEDEDLIIIEIETKEDKEKSKDLDYEKDCIDLGKNVKVSICDKDGNILDMSVCHNEITVMKFVGDVDEIDVSTAMDYADQGIDVFNAQDSFFNDRCNHFDNDKDVILSDRRDDYFQNVSFCDEGCKYNGMDFDLMIAKCACDAGGLQEDDILEDEFKKENEKGITLNDLANSFTSEIFSFNFDVIKCYNLVFNLDILKQNIGFFSLLTMIGLQIILLTYFSIKKLKPIRNYMLVFEPFNPRIDPPNPPKKRATNRSDVSQKKYSNIYNLLNLKDSTNHNLNKKEKEIQKSILITNLLNRAKFKKNNKNKQENKNNDDALVIHYENSDDSSGEKSEGKKYNDSVYSKSSNSYSENTRQKYRSIFNYYLKTNSQRKFRDEINKEKSFQNNNSLNSKQMKTSFSNPKIFKRNNKNLNSKHIFSKETILGENTRNQSKENNIHQRETITLESNDNVYFNEIKNFWKKGNKGKNNNINLIKYGKLNLKEKNTDYIKEKYEKEDEKNLSKINSQNGESEQSQDIKTNKKKKRRIKNNKKTLKNTLNLKNGNLNIITSVDNLFSKNKSNRLKESNSVKYYHKNKVDKKELQIPEETKKTESNMNQAETIKTKDKNKNIGNMRLKYKRVNYSYSREDYNDMNFDEALVADNRKFCLIYISYLLEEHIIFNTFFTDLYLDLRSIKMSFLLFGIEINFFLNAIFYTDEYISDTYHNDGVLDFFSSLPKSIYSFIVTLIISGLLKMLSSSKKQLMKIIEEKEDKEEYLAAVDIELNKLRKKLTWFFIIVFILGLFFCYYVSAFCAVYTNSQTFWLYGCLESVALDLLTPFLICFLLACFRYIGLKKRIKCLYNMAVYLGIIM